MSTLPPIGWQHEHLASCDSTQDLVIARGLLGAEHGLVISCDEQLKGRGRHGRTWLSSNGSLLFSALLDLSYPNHTLDVSRAPPLALIMGLAATDAVREQGVDVLLKWPNDLWLDNKKAGGILCTLEFRNQAPAHAFCVVGVGLNLEFFPADHDALLKGRATAMPTLDRARLWPALFKAMSDRYERYVNGDTMLSELGARLALVGQNVRVETPRGTITGQVHSLASDYALLLQHDGAQTRVDVGEVWPLEGAIKNDAWLGSKK